MHKCYHQLAYDERCQIRVLLSKGFSMRSIAGDLGRSPATISRELARNRGERSYRHGQAQAMSSARGSEASGVHREEGGDLYLHLRRRGRKPNWKGGRGHMPGRVDIAERPAVVEKKSRVGGWELDPIIGARHRGALLSSVDRVSWYTILELLGGKAAVPVTEGLDAGFYFATPYHSRERGRNEHVNGLVREYFPKGADFRQVTAEQVREVGDRLNHRPRKVLGYRTPFEVFHGGLAPS